MKPNRASVIWGSLSIMTYVYVVGELSHFLVGIVSRPMAQEIHYGDKACLPNPEADYQSRDCQHLLNSTECELLLGENTTAPCIWDYSGLGMEYQILAGPAFIFVFSTAGVLIGFLADRVNRKLVILACSGVVAATTGLMGASTTYWHLVVFIMLMGAGESGFSPVCSSMISDMFSESQRAMALGIFNWGIYFGNALSFAVGNFVTQANIAGMGWRWSFIVAGLMGLVATILLLIIPEPKRNSQEMSKGNTENHYSEISETRTDVENDGSRRNWWSGSSGFREVLKSLLNWPMIVIAVAASIRHTAGFSWAYNTQLYFQTYYPEYNLGLWVPGCVIGGSVGVAVGGYVSDKLVRRLGVRSRLYVLAGSQLLAAPLAAGVLYIPPPGAFFSLLGSFIFAEMWFGVLFAVIVELVPQNVRSTSIAVFLFVMNNIGGNLPVIVDPISHALGYRTALLIMCPGGYFASAVVFFLASFMV